MNKDLAQPGTTSSPSAAQDGADDRLWFWQPSATARAVADLLKADPRGWEIDDYVAHHAGANIGIWVSNGDYGIRLWSGGRDGWRGVGIEPRKANRLHVYRALRRYRGGPSRIVASARAAIAKANGEQS